MSTANDLSHLKVWTNIFQYCLSHGCFQWGLHWFTSVRIFCFYRFCVSTTHFYSRNCNKEKLLLYELLNFKGRSVTLFFLGPWERHSHISMSGRCFIHMCENSSLSCEQMRIILKRVSKAFILIFGTWMHLIANLRNAFTSPGICSARLANAG